jgi:hypothetical protein
VTNKLDRAQMTRMYDDLRDRMVETTIACLKENGLTNGRDDDEVERIVIKNVDKYIAELVEADIGKLN